MAGFLTQFAEDGRFGVAGGMLARARSRYSDKQIATAIGQGGHGLKIGDALKPGSALHTQMARSQQGNPNSWIFNYMGPSGAVGYGGLMNALGSGRTTNQLIQAGHLTAGGTQNYGVPGFGERASEYLAMMKRDELHKTQIEQMQDNSNALMLKAIDALKPAEPPKPTLGSSAIRQFVPGTTRFQGQRQATKKGSRSGTLKRRFGREHFSPLAIGGGAGGAGATSSKVLNL